MAGGRIPGPIDMNPPLADDITPTEAQFLHRSSTPGPIGMNPPSAAGEMTRAPDFNAPLERIPTSEGKSRGLTPGEIAMARLIFKDSIDYAKVKVHNGEYLWFGMQPNNEAMTPNGEMYFNKAYFKEDFSAENEFNRHWFIHEMVYVWQHQLGYAVKVRGALRIGLSYEYTLDAGKTLSGYNMEAQGDVIADYFVLKFLQAPDAMTEWAKKNNYRNELKLYEKVLGDFIANPKDTKNLP